jgi:3-phosphoshikimate 1-carboxyvinyltransferase
LPPRRLAAGRRLQSASYLLAAATLFPGRTVLAGVHGDTMQGERAIIPIIVR